MFDATYINSLSKQMVLYVINEDDFNHFKNIASTNVEKLPANISASLQGCNIFIMVCNVWFALRRDKKNYLDETRRMTHTSTYFQLEYISRHKSIQKFISLYKTNDVQLFFLSYFISIACLTWVIALMERVGQHVLIEHYAIEDNFVTNDENLSNEAFQRELDYQAIFIKEMIKNTSQTTEFADALNDALLETKALLRSYDSQKK